MIPQLGPLEILVVILVALLVFGPTRLPEVARQVGRGLREVKRLQEQLSSELHEVLHADDTDEADPPATFDPGATLAVPIRPADPGSDGRASGTTPEVGRAPSRFQPPAAD